MEDFADGWEASLGARLTVLVAGTRGAELRLDLALGPDTGAQADYYRPVGKSGLFVAPRVELRSRRQRVSVEGDLTAGYRTWQALAGLEIVTHARWLATAPGLPSGFAQARLTSTSFLPVGSGGRVFLSLVGSAASSDQLPPLHQSTLGGPFRLGAFERDQVRGVRTGYAGTGYLHQLGRMPDLIGGPIYARAWVEAGWVKAGKAFVPASHGALRNVSAGLLVETMLGAVFASTSLGSDGPRFTFGLGRAVW